MAAYLGFDIILNLYTFNVNLKYPNLNDEFVYNGLKYRWSKTRLGLNYRHDLPQFSLN